MKIDVALVSGRRPELLSKTLDSFRKNIFDNFDIGVCYANIDPFCGRPEDEDLCREIIADHFPSADITAPKTPSFGKAVKTTWSKVTAPFVLHMEDDWVVLQTIRPDDIFPLFFGETAAVRLMSKEVGWNGRDIYLQGRREKRKLLGIPLWRGKRSVFGTSPGFFSGPFVNRCAELMNPDLDPEKQMRPPHNPALLAYTDRFRCRLLTSTGRTEVIQDIGREWREERGIVKVVAKGRSVWTAAGCHGNAAEARP